MFLDMVGSSTLAVNNGLTIGLNPGLNSFQHDLALDLFISLLNSPSVAEVAYGVMKFLAPVDVMKCEMLYISKLLQ
jgi:hypothetical protein